MITELNVPRSKLADFLDRVAGDLRRMEASVIYGTVRLLERDEESFLAWAREPWACVIFNLCVEHSNAGLARTSHACFCCGLTCLILTAFSLKSTWTGCPTQPLRPFPRTPCQNQAFLRLATKTREKCGLALRRMGIMEGTGPRL